jgi:hypothetical protein
MRGDKERKKKGALRNAMKPTDRHNRRTGFSLLATSLVLTGAALLMVSMIPGGDAGSYNAKTMASIKKLNAVETAIVAFMAKNGRLPCPADGGYDAGVHNFGIEAANPGACTGGTPAAPMGPDAGTGFVVEGDIPTKTLGLDDAYAFDAWGRRFSYAVDARATVATGANSCATLTTGGIQILKTKGGSPVANVMHAFISHGPDGQGAFPAQGATVAKRIWTGNADADKLLNAGVDNTGAYSAANFTNTLVRKDPTATFSDIVWYADYLKNRCVVGGICELTANQGGGVLQGKAPGNAKTAYTSNSDATCTPHTLSCANSKLSCSTGNISDCQYATCAVTGAAPCSPSANQGGGSMASGGAPRTEYTNASDGTCTAYSMTCTNGILSCSSGNMAGCQYASCGLSCTLSANQGGGALLSGNSATEFVDAGDPSCTAHTLLCTNGVLTCDGSGTLTNCAYNSCNKSCGLSANQGGGTLNGTGPGNTATEYTSNSDATCAAHTLTCTNGALSCSTGNMSDCGYNSCSKTCAMTGNQGGGTLNGSAPGNTRTPEYTNASGASCPVNTLTCANGTLTCSTGSMADCQYSSCSTSKFNGHRNDGGNPGDSTGNFVTSADFNCDGIPDLIIGADGASPGGRASAGSVYVVFGTQSGFPDPLPLTTINGVNGVRFDGANAGDLAGNALAAGDINVDACSDIVIGAPDAGYNGLSQSGSAYVVYGGSGPKGDAGKTWANSGFMDAAGIFTLNPVGTGTGFVNGNNGFRLDGDAANAYCGSALATGDINNDGKTDIAIGSYGYNSTAAGAGSVYVVYGGATMKDGTSWGTCPCRLSTTGKPINASDGFRLDGSVASDSVGEALAVGDVNGDGIADIVTDAQQVQPNGSVYIAFGGATKKSGSAWATTQTFAGLADATNGYRLDDMKSENFAYNNQSIAIGDVNCDTIGDIIIGANDKGGLKFGHTYVVFGRVSPMSRANYTMDASPSGVINGTLGFRLDGATAGDYAGWSVGTGDIDRSGCPSVLVGATGASYSGANAGAVYAVHAAKLPVGTVTATLDSGGAVINGAQGFRIDGNTAGDQSGFSICTGDINGDGYPDIAIGATAASYNGAGSGSVYVVDGQSAPYAATNNLMSLTNATPITAFAGMRIDGGATNQDTGYSLAVGDINGDGIPDLVIGADNAMYNGGSSGSVYVVFGTTSGFPDPLPLNSLNGSNGFRLDGGAANDFAGFSLAVGDINGDGTADIVIGAPYANYNALSFSGAVYVVYGGTTMKNGTAWSTCPCTLTAGGAVINATNGFRLDGATSNDNLGFTVAAGDINGDGTTDIVIGADMAGYNGVHSGSTYVVFGGATMKNGTAWGTTNSLSTTGSVINATNGYRLDGATAGDRAGYSVAVGDVNGDGKTDLVIAAALAVYNGAGSGSTYVVYGGATMKNGTAWATTNSLSATGPVINAANGFRLDGVAGDGVGDVVATGDVNGDGITDIIIGAPNKGASTGSVFVVYGGATMKNGTAWGITNSLANPGTVINATNGFRLDGGSGGELFGTSIAAGDVNGDGIPDIIIGAHSAGYNGKSLSGSAYVVFGGATMKDGTAWAATNAMTSGGAVVNGTNGTRFDGVNNTDETGNAVAVCNVNNGAFADVIIGADLAGYNGRFQSGSVYVYPGRAGGWPNPTSSLETLCNSPGC